MVYLILSNLQVPLPVKKRIRLINLSTEAMGKLCPILPMESHNWAVSWLLFFESSELYRATVCNSISQTTQSLIFLFGHEHGADSRHVWKL